MCWHLNLQDDGFAITYGAHPETERNDRGVSVWYFLKERENAKTKLKQGVQDREFVRE